MGENDPNRAQVAVIGPATPRSGLVSIRVNEREVFLT